MKTTLAAIAAFAAVVSFADDPVPPTPEPEPAHDTQYEIMDKFVSGSGPETYDAGLDVTVIRNSAFADNRAIKSIRATEVTEVGSAAFRGCASLVTVDLQKLTDVSKLTGAFAGCPKLVDINLTAYVFEGAAKTPGYPWGVVNPAAVFTFANGSFDRTGRKIE